MGYRPQAKSAQSGRGHQKSRREKKKTREKKHRSSDKYLLEETRVSTSAEVVEKTLSRLRSLGNQIFAVFPFNVYFDDWLVSLKDALIAFESSPSVSVDEQFAQERSQILANAERALEERRRKEVSLGEAITSLSDNKILLERVEEEYATKAREIEKQKNSETTRLHSSIDDFRKELDDLAMVKAGLFRAISKKTKAQKEAETTQRLNTAQSELELTVQNSTAEQESLRSECEKRKQLAIEQIGNLQKEVECAEVDGSLEDRRIACEALANAVNALLQRQTL